MLIYNKNLSVSPISTHIPVKKITNAKNIFQVPNVTIKGGSRNLVTNKPLNAPVNTPATIPTIIAGSVGIPISTDNLPIKTDARTIIAATLRSIPAVKIISVWAAARMPTMVTC